MRTFRALVVAALTVGGLALMAPGASAAAPASSTSFCKAVSAVGNNVSEKNSGSDNTAKLAAALRKASKSAPSKVKAAMLLMADYFDAASGAKPNPEKIASFLQKNGAKYGKAVATFSGYYAKTCAGVN